MARKKRIVAVIDTETDPFSHGADIQPFCAGFYDGNIYREFWGDDCIEALCSFLEAQNCEYLIYAHNGGKFDFFFFLKKGKLTNPSLVINGRIVKCQLGKHEMRDSFAIIPAPLRDYKKDDTDYSWFTKEKRESYKKPILEYLKSDCVNLYELVSAFVKRFGPKITIGATAISEIQKFHPVVRLGEKHDEEFRPFYFGGRVECFETGKLIDNFVIDDVNSMYPGVMKNCVHPTGERYIQLDNESAHKQFDWATGKLKNFQGMYFIQFEGSHKGCLPTRTKTGLDFSPSSGMFFSTSHEIQTAIELGLVTVRKIHAIKIPVSFITFDKFIDTFTADKIAAEERGDVITRLFSKLCMNAGYGKFSSNPRNFREFFFVDRSDDKSINDLEEWKTINPDAEMSIDALGYEIWDCPAEVKDKSFYDVAVAASITSAARAVLMRAIHFADRPIYCDTDSIISRGLRNVELHKTKLGAWKREESATTVYIAGKKLYACWRDGEFVKIASKGAKLTGAEIARLCAGDVIEWNSTAPNFKLDGSQKYLTRRIQKRY